MLHYCTEVLCQWTLSFVRSVAGGEAEGRRAQETNGDRTNRSNSVPLRDSSTGGLCRRRRTTLHPPIMLINPS